jgi:hypothetical protein
MLLAVSNSFIVQANGIQPNRQSNTIKEKLSRRWVKCTALWLRLTPDLPGEKSMRMKKGIPCESG